MTDPAGGTPRAEAESIRAEIRAELDLLHGRANALLAAEAFLTIAYTAAMTSAVRYVWIIAVVLGLLGLVLVLAAFGGIRTTAAIIERWTVRLEQLLGDGPAAGGVLGAGSRLASQRGGLRFFRIAPVALLVAWVVLIALALALVLR